MSYHNFYEHHRGSAATWAVVITVAVMLAILLLMPRSNKSGGGSTAGAAPCLVEGINLAQHIHPQLSIIIDGNAEVIPAEIGIGACEQAVHTHDATGVIHVEAQDLHAYTLGEFFATWKKPMVREGYELTMTVNDAPSEDLGMLKLKDGQRIVLRYKKLSANPTASQ